MQPETHRIFVENVNGRHVCTPTVTLVHTKDTVEWVAFGVLEVRFPTGSPFTEADPFGIEKPGTVAPLAPKTPPKAFDQKITFDGQDRPVDGRIIHLGP